MDFIPVIESFPGDTEANHAYQQLNSVLSRVDGICFYKHPSLGSNGPDSAPDFAVLARNLNPLVVRCVRATIEDIESVAEDSWVIRGEKVDSPVLEVEDLTENLRHRFQRERPLRGKLTPRSVLAFPALTAQQFQSKFQIPWSDDVLVLWQETRFADLAAELRDELDDDHWLLAKSVFQSASVLSRRVTVPVEERGNRLSDAIRILERRIAILDLDQLRGAVQIVPGPQRIRGLAGTGKTVLLAMKAATIHSLYPERKILFTFHTQSLYNQARRLITRFYRENNDTDPNWDNLHVRHAWGSKSQRGVYRELALMIGEAPIDLREARARDPEVPFRACCNQLLTRTLPPQYDFILVDEGQDLPAEFFRILYKLSQEPHRIYFAYDELQNLLAIQLPDPAELFGRSPSGRPLVSLAGAYPGDMDKDLVLYKSYRCPQEVLMVAHAIGLGIKGPRGCVQMLPDRDSWEAVGYRVEHGGFRTNDRTVIYRPPENSPNPLSTVYAGPDRPVATFQFDSRDDEIRWVIQSIVRDVREEGVKPEDIIVVWFDSARGRKMLPMIQQGLLTQQIASTVPGIADSQSDFAEEGRVTLTTAFRAKGNESPVVYLLAADVLYSFAGEIEYRNRAFTCISRAKGWVRISGIGSRMASLTAEIDQILSDLPRFRFAFPDMEQIRKLGAAETNRRRKILKDAAASLRKLLEVDPTALEDLDPDALGELEDKLRQLRSPSGAAE